MADFDLSALSARINSLKPELKKGYQRLDKKWCEVAESFKKLAIPQPVCVVIDSNPHCPDMQYRHLEWIKWKGKKRFCVVGYDFDPSTQIEETEVSPYEEWSAEERLNLLSLIPDLFDEAENVTKKFIQATMFSAVLTEDKLSEILIEHGHLQANGAEMSGLIADSNACGWGPDVVEDIELSRNDDGSYGFSAIVKYFHEGPYKEYLQPALDCIEEHVNGTADYLDGEWGLDMQSEFKTFGPMGDGD